ncbi:MAG TPA: hypothetical protein VFR14_02265, partial [Candidatus Limnocylindrales bacterium]|nr:hypothetical protein [Candidatus Limnocylindrales bacterium]
LARVLDSLRAADYPAGEAVPLVISVDGGPRRDDAVVRIAEAAQWPAGPKEVVAHDEHLGLIGHYLWAGDQVERFGSVALIEDDQVVSPRWHAFASVALVTVGGDDRIAQVNLGAPWFNGFTSDPFEPIHDGADTFYGRFPFMGAVAITSDGWRRLRPALAGSELTDRPTRRRALHPAYGRLSADEWLPRLAHHLADTGRHVLYPRVALALPWGDAGAHFARPTRRFRTPLDRRRAAWTIHPLDDADAIYDPFQELDATVVRRLVPDLAATEFEMDLWATRPRRTVGTACVVTTRPVRRPIRSFGAELRPLEANVIGEVPGDAIRLARTGDVDWSRLGTLRARAALEAWVTRDRPRGIARQVVLRGTGRLERLVSRTARR